MFRSIVFWCALLCLYFTEFSLNIHHGSFKPGRPGQCGNAKHATLHWLPQHGFQHLRPTAILVKQWSTGQPANKKGCFIQTLYWLVVSTPLKNISQLGLLYPWCNIWKNKIHVPNHQPVIPFIDSLAWGMIHCPAYPLLQSRMKLLEHCRPIMST